MPQPRPAKAKPGPKATTWPETFPANDRRLANHAAMELQASILALLKVRPRSTEEICTELPDHDEVSKEINRLRMEGKIQRGPHRLFEIRTVPPKEPRIELPAPARRLSATGSGLTVGNKTAKLAEEVEDAAAAILRATQALVRFYQRWDREPTKEEKQLINERINELNAVLNRGQ